MKKIILLPILFLLITLKIVAYDVLGIGSPCIDLIYKVSEDFFEDTPLQKGGWIRLEKNEYLIVFKKANRTGPPYKATGGSTANMIKGLSQLGVSCALTGKVGNDDRGIFIETYFQKKGVSSLLFHTDTPTTQILCLVTPDGERAFCSYGKSQRELSEKDLCPDFFKGIRHLHIDGYQLCNGLVIEKSIQYAKENGATISFDLAAPEIVLSYKERLLNSILPQVNLIFANEKEAFALTHLEPNEASQELKKKCDIAIVKMGEQGCWITSTDEHFHSKGFLSNVIDTTGAGDLFASAFLFGYLKNHSLKKTAQYANLAGSHAVEVLGGEIAQEKWDKLFIEFNKSIE